MTTASPFPPLSSLSSFFSSLASKLQPPAWVVDETQQKIILFLNHVLMQEQEARERLLRKKGSVVHVQWGAFALALQITPAGLLGLAEPGSRADLKVELTAGSPVEVIQSVIANKTPSVKIEGDVQLAAELGWLADNVRWDFEEDLSRLVGDAPAHALADVGRRIAAGVKQFVSSLKPSAPATSAFSEGSPANTVRAAS
jgi:ubiquinone biosynthesis accessory factor UbiJ